MAYASVMVDQLPAESGQKILHVLLGLFEQRPQCLPHIGQAQLGGLAESITVPLELLLLETEIGLKSAMRIRRLRDAPHSGGRLPPRNDT